jgi:hypothetical protein
LIIDCFSPLARYFDTPPALILIRHFFTFSSLIFRQAFAFAAAEFSIFSLILTLRHYIFADYHEAAAIDTPLSDAERQAAFSAAIFEDTLIRWPCH